MKKSRVWKWIATIGTSAVLLFAFIFAMGGDLFSKPDVSEAPQSAQAAGLVERPSGATFGQFANGYTYVFTDKGAMTELRAGKIASDLNTQTVSTSSTHGSATNPYVIENVNDWENFAKFAGTSANNTKDKVFVLAKDIDFTGVTFRMVPAFAGTLYGVGHKLSNITATLWQQWNGSAWANTTTAVTNGGFGVIGYMTGATVADVVLENFTYSGMHVLQGLNTQWGNYVGGLIGVSANGSYVMNCHVQGTLTGGSWAIHALPG